jgi:phosphatidylglycerophosphatase A
MRRLALLLASNCGLGYAPVAPGTVGTLAGLPAFWLLAGLSPTNYLLTWAVITALAVWAAGVAGGHYRVADDRRIVIDELAGYLVTVALLPWNWLTALLGFAWFRLIDILKPPPVGWIDRHCKNGFGVVFDDVAAGLYAALALRLTLPLLQP